MVRHFCYERCSSLTCRVNKAATIAVCSAGKTCREDPCSIDQGCLTVEARKEIVRIDLVSTTLVSDHSNGCDPPLGKTQLTPEHQ